MEIYGNPLWLSSPKSLAGEPTNEIVPLVHMNMFSTLFELADTAPDCCFLEAGVIKAATADGEVTPSTGMVGKDPDQKETHGSS